MNNNYFSPHTRTPFSRASWRAWLVLWAWLAWLPLASMGQVFTIGTATGLGNTAFSYPTPFGDWYAGARAQFIYRASELTAAGFTAGPINQIGFNVLNPNTSAPNHENYTIWIANTTQNDLSSWVLTDIMTQVFGPVVPAYQPVAGWNLFTLSAPFVWDGTSNIVVQTFHNSGNFNYTANASTEWTTGLPANSSRSYYQDGATDAVILNEGSPSFGTNTNRPNLRIVRFQPCSGAPAPGTLAAASLCNSLTVPLSVANGAEQSFLGLSFQWEINTGSGFTPIPGATNPTYTYVGTPADYFNPPQIRRRITCTATTNTAVTNAITLDIPYTITSANLPYLLNFESTWVNGCATRDIPSTHWKATPATGNTSWRRVDDAASAGWSFATGGAYSPVSASAGIGSARFHTFGANLGQSGTLELFVNMPGTNPKEIKFSYINPSGSDQLVVSYSTDGGASFTNLMTLGVSPTWTVQAATLNINANNVVVRFRATSDFGNDDIGFDDLSIVNKFPCAGVPNPGTAVANPSSFCDSGFTTLTVTGGDDTAGVDNLTFLWEESSDSLNWGPATGTNNLNVYVTPTVTSTRYYRRVTTCTNSGQSATSTVASFVKYAPVYATLPFAEDFENWVDGCNVKDVPDGGNWLNTPATGNASWRRQDQGVTANWTNALLGIVTPATGLGAANFHSYASPSSSVGTLDLYVNCNTPNQKILRFKYRNQGTNVQDKLEVLVSLDGGATFATPIATLLSTGASVAWQQKEYPLLSGSATTIIRLRATAGGDFTDIGIDDLEVVDLGPCVGTPVGGNTLSSPPIICQPGPATLTVSGSSDLVFAPGSFTFLWEQSADGVTWVPAGPGVNTLNSFTTTVFGPGSPAVFYRRRLTCNTNNQFVYSTPVKVEFFNPGFFPLVSGTPYYQSFDQWQNGCLTFDVPGPFWKNTPTQGDNSWRRQDQGATANWTGTDFTPPFLGAGAAKINTWNIFQPSAGTNTTGQLDLYVNLSVNNFPKRIKFYYRNPFAFSTAPDFLRVRMTGAGNSANPFFTTLAEFIEENGTLTNGYSVKVVDVPSNLQQNATAIIRFEGFYGGPAFNNSSIAFDELTVYDLPPCDATPVGGQASVITPPNGNWCSATELTLGVQQASDDPVTATRSGYTYQWEMSTDGGNTWTVVGTGQTLQITLNIDNATVLYRRRIICPTDNDSFAYSTIVTLNRPYNITYGTIPFTEGFESIWVNGGATQDRPGGANTNHWRNTPCSGNSSWRRNNGETSWTNLVAPWIRITPVSGTGAATFHSYRNNPNTNGPGSLDLYLNASPAQTPRNLRLSFLYSNANNGVSPFPNNTNADNMRVLISENGGRTFQQVMALGSTEGSPWVQYHHDFTTSSNQLVIRFRAFGDVTGFTDIGLDDVKVVELGDCASLTPLAGGTALAGPGCNNPPFILSVAGSSNDTHGTFSFLWEVSTDGGSTWSPAAGTNNEANYLLPNIVNASRYRRTITCGANSAISVPVDVAAPYPLNYATLPYEQKFESWVNGCATRDVPDNFWRNRPFTGNDSWRRQDQGNTAGWALLNNPLLRVQPFEGQGAANFNSSGISSLTPPRISTGILELFFNGTASPQKKLSFFYINPTRPKTDPPVETGGSLDFSNDDFLEVEYSTDGGLTYTPLDTIFRQENWQQYVYTFPGNTANMSVRFKATSDYDQTRLSLDMGIDNLKLNNVNPCAAPLTGGETKASNAVGNACDGLSALLYVEGSSADTQSGITYQWQQKIIGVDPDFVDIPGATSEFYSASPIFNTEFRRVIRCGAGVQASSVPFVFNTAFVPSFATLPYTQGFETWQNGCGVNDIPASSDGKTYWRNTPYNTNSSWRRQDQGASAFWTLITQPAFLGGGQVVPATGFGAASFHSYAAPLNNSGTLDFYVNASGTKTKVIEFKYSNAAHPRPAAFGVGSVSKLLTNNDRMDVLISTDAGFTFDAVPLLSLTNTERRWQSQRIVLPNLNNNKTVIRFRAVSDAGGTDIGIDDFVMRDIFATDAGITQVRLDRCSALFANIVVDITNFGSTPLTNVPVSFVHNGITYNETFTGTIPLFGTATYTFLSPVRIVGGSIVLTSIRTNLPGDGDASNDGFTNLTLFAGQPPLLPYTENFNNPGLPGGWRTTQAPDSDGWKSATPNTSNNGTFPRNPLSFDFAINTGNHDGSRFMANDDDAGGVARDGSRDYLISPVFDFTGYENVSLTFKGYFNNFFGGKARVEASTNGGQTWIVVPGGDFVNGTWRTYTVSLAQFNNTPNVTIAFRYDDEGQFAQGVAIDDVTIAGNAVTVPQATFSSPQVRDAFVNVNTKDHVLYRMNVAAAVGDVTLSDFIFKTSGTYQVSDLKPNSFKFWYSVDSILSASNTPLGVKPIVPSGSELVFNCMNFPIKVNQTGYFFVTVDVAANAVPGRNINIQQPNLATDLFTKNGTKTGTLIAGGVQTFALPNNRPTSANKVVKVIRNKSYTFNTADFAFVDADATTPLHQHGQFQGVKIKIGQVRSGGQLRLGNTILQEGQVLDILPTQLNTLVFQAPNNFDENWASFLFQVFDGREYSVLEYRIQVDVINDRIAVPELFSPNADSRNENFRVLIDPSLIGSITFKIFDRNNNLVYETSNVSEATQVGWDGKKGGTDQPAGAYIWYVEGTYSDGKPLTYDGKNTGIIRLLR